MKQTFKQNGKIHILVVDDERSLLEPLTEYLSTYFEVFPAENGKEAMQLMQETQIFFDVALVDMTLITGPNGIELMKKIRDQSPNTEVIICTGWGPEQRQEALHAGAFRFLEKPFKNEELVLLIRNAAQQVKLHAISREMISTSNLENLQQLIIDAAISLVFADDAAIVIYNPLAEKLEIKKSQRAVQTSLCFDRHMEHTALTKGILKTGEEYSVPDILSEKELSVCLRESGFKAFIGLPIPGENGNQGVLYVYSRNEHHFDEHGHTTILRTITAQAGLALTNTWIRKKMEIHNLNMEALVRTGRDLATSTDRENLYQHAWRFVRERLGLGIFFIASYDQKTDELSFPFFLEDGEPIAQPPRKLRSRNEWGPTGWVVKEEKELFYPTHAKGEALCKDMGISIFITGKRSECCFFYPIQIDNKTVGAISVQSSTPNGLTKLTLDALRALGNQVSTALRNIQLHEIEQRQSREAQALQQAIQAVTKIIDPKKVIEQVLCSLKSVVPFDYASVQLLIQDGDQVYFELIDGQGFPNLDEIRNVRYEVNQRKTYPEVYHQLKSKIVSDIQCISDDSPPLPSTPQDIHSWMGVPLVVNNKIIGLITLDSRISGFYTDHHARLAETFAASVAQALDNAYQHKTTQQAHDMLKAMTESLGLLRSEKEPNRLLFETVHKAVDLLNFKYGALFYYNEQLDAIELSISFKLAEELSKTLLPSLTDLVSQTAREGKLNILNIDQWNETSNNKNLLTAVAVPIKHPNQPELKRILLIVDDRHRVLDNNDRDILFKWVDQAAIAIRTSQLITGEKRRYEQLNILEKINEYIQKRRKLDDILHIILTGITAGYGLGFNRAALLLVDTNNNSLRGKIAIGNLNIDENQKDWIASHESNMDDFRHYLEALDRETIAPTPLDTAIRGKVFATPNGEIQHFLNQLSNQKFLEIGPENLTLIANLGNAFQASSKMVVVPLILQNEIIGLIIADNKFNLAPISLEDKGALLTFANTAAVAIEHENTLSALENTKVAAANINKVSIIGDLHQTLKSICEAAKQVLKCDMFTLYIYDHESQRFTGREHYGCRDEANIRLPEDLRRTSSPYKILDLENEPYYCTENAPSDPFFTGSFAQKEGIIATMAIKLTYKGNSVGALFINYRKTHQFTADEINTALLFSDQAAIAIQNAQLYDRSVQQALYLEALYEAGKVLTSSLALSETLDQLSEQARILTGSPNIMDRFCNVLLINGTKLCFEASSPDGFIAPDIDLNSSCIGITGRAYREKSSQLVEDVSLDQDYYPFKDDTKSELAVPIIHGDEVIGVINIESSTIGAFSTQDIRNLELLAAQAAIAIQNARAYADLQKAKEIISTRTSLAYINFSSGVWHHSVTNDARAISWHAGLSQITLDKIPLSKDEKEKIANHLTEIKKLATRILQKPLTPPLRSEQGAEPILIGQLIKERGAQLMERYGATAEFPPINIDLEKSTMVWGSPEWLRLALDILVDNAAKAVSNQPIRRIDIGIKTAKENMVEIYVQDTGPGIPKEVRDKIGDEYIPDVNRHGMGVGLVMAKLIVQAYGGQLVLDYTGPQGTNMVILLPVYQNTENEDRR